MSFYKILGGVAGAALAGPADFVAEARVWQRRQGGNLVRMWPLALAARRGLRERLPRVPAYHERAVAIARALRDVEGVIVRPDPPHTNMMHVHLRAAPEAVLRAAIAIAERDRIAVLRGLRPVELSGWSCFELTVGEGAMALSDDEVASLARELLR